MQQEKISNYPSNVFGRFWMKVPLIVRSILTGTGISYVGIGIWTLLVTSLPLPWSVVLMGTVLIFYWMYFSGKWKPLSTQAFRRLSFRQTRLERPLWLWGLAAASLIFITLNASLIVTFRFVEFQPDIFKSLSLINDLPGWQAWSIVIGISMVAGICEEIGFRGYMQKPIEQRYGPAIGISITSLLFVVVHLHQAWAGGILVQIFVISSMIGYLAYATNSLLPGIIAHVTFDIINVSYWWSDVLGTFERKPISMTGVDNHFILSVVILLFSMGLFVVAIRKLLKLKLQRDESK